MGKRLLTITVTVDGVGDGTEEGEAITGELLEAPGPGGGFLDRPRFTTRELLLKFLSGVAEELEEETYESGTAPDLYARFCSLRDHGGLITDYFDEWSSDGTGDPGRVVALTPGELERWYAMMLMHYWFLRNHAEVSPVVARLKVTAAIWDAVGGKKGITA